MAPIALPADVRFILQTLQSHGYEAFIVGGCVRDSLMGLPPQDWDIATSALPPQAKALFSHTFDTGLQHGTITVVLNHTNYEVTTYRIDGEYTDGRRPVSVTFAVGIQDDLARRDFTMNAIAYHPEQGFVDPFNGQGDIAARTIRCVGTPAHRFREDALRMLRAVRFAGQLGFDIEAETLQAITLLSSKLTQISAERIREELTRLLSSPHPEKVALLASTGLLPHVLLGRLFGGDLPAIIRRMQHCPPEAALRTALFLSWAGEDIAPLLRRLRFDNKSIREISTYVRLLPFNLPHDRYEIKKLMSQISPAYTKGLLTLQHDHTAIKIVDDIMATGECYSLDGLAVNGGHLIAAGCPPGKGIGLGLAHLLKRVMRDPSLNNYDTLIRIIRLSLS